MSIPISDTRFFPTRMASPSRSTKPRACSIPRALNHARRSFAPRLRQERAVLGIHGVEARLSLRRGWQPLIRARVFRLADERQMPLLGPEHNHQTCSAKAEIT